MANLTKGQLNLLDTHRQTLDDIFSSLAGMVKTKNLDRPVKKKLTRVLSMLDKSTDYLEDIVSDEEINEGEEVDPGKGEGL